MMMMNELKEFPNIIFIASSKKEKKEKGERREEGGFQDIYTKFTESQYNNETMKLPRMPGGGGGWWNGRR